MDRLYNFLGKLMFSNRLYFGVGALLTFIVFAASSALYLRDVTALMHNSMDILERQCLNYNVLLNTDKVNNMFKVNEYLLEFTRRLNRNPQMAEDREYMTEFVRTTKMSGILILDENFRIVSGSSQRTLLDDDVDMLVGENGMQDLLQHPNKVVSANTLLHGFEYDISAMARQDRLGLVMVYYQHRSGWRDSNENEMKILLSGMTMGMNGTFAIAKDGAVIAGNMTDDRDVYESSKEVFHTLDSFHSGYNLNFFNCGGHFYCGSRINRYGYDIYVYYHMLDLLFYMVLPALVFMLLYCIAFFVHGEARKRIEAAKDAEYLDKLIAERNEAKRANLAKTEFLRRITHDIRTPINAIQGTVRMAEHFCDNLDKQAESRKKVLLSSNILLDLVNDVLDMSRIESGEIHLESKPFNLQEIFEVILHTLQNQAEEMQIDLRLCTDLETIPTDVVGSPLHLRQILMNIISNAVKYGRQGGYVHVYASAWSLGEDEAMYEFVCEDNGQGMSQEFQKTMFEPFAQEHGEVRTRYQGTGLGLAIVKSLLDKMGGEVRVESERGKGSTFTIRLPLQLNKEQVAEETVNLEDLLSDKAFWSDLKVLLVEDNMLNMEIANFMLSNQGMQVTEAYNGQEAVDAFTSSEEGEFDVIVMDLMMPVLNGLEATKIIRSLSRSDSQTVPIIALSANAFVDEQEQEFEAGMDAHVNKPIDENALFRTIYSFVKNGRFSQ